MVPLYGLHSVYHGLIFPTTGDMIFYVFFALYFEVLRHFSQDTGILFSSLSIDADCELCYRAPKKELLYIFFGGRK